MSVFDMFEEHSAPLKLTSLLIKSTEIAKHLTVKVKGTRDTFKVLELIDTYGHGQLKISV